MCLNIELKKCKYIWQSVRYIFNFSLLILVFILKVLSHSQQTIKKRVKRDFKSHGTDLNDPKWPEMWYLVSKICHFKCNYNKLNVKDIFNI